MDPGTFQIAIMQYMYHLSISSILPTVCAGTSTLGEYSCKLYQYSTWVHPNHEHDVNPERNLNGVGERSF